MGEYAEDLLARQHPEVFGSGYHGRRRGDRPAWPAKGMTPHRPGLDPAEWDYENPGDCLWVTKGGEAIRLADMKTSHLVNTWRFLVRNNGAGPLSITPMGRAFVAEQQRRGVRA